MPSPTPKNATHATRGLSTNAAGLAYGVAKNVSLHSVRVLDCNGRTLASIIKKVIAWGAGTATDGNGRQ